MTFVDLRSDTLTRPSSGMRAAMAAAEVGDDVYGEDPTVNRLEERVAELFGREAAVFVPTGTMGNQICLRLVCPPGGEVLTDTDAHVVTYEGGGAAQHGGLQTRTVPAVRGLLEVADVAPQIRPAGWHTVTTAALSVEQTHNRGGGAVYPFMKLVALRELTLARRVRLHCDGARIWNASVATRTALSAYGGLFDTLSVCLSKGLGAPVGSLVVCDAAQAEEARVLRHRLGGAWRQAGVLAAAGLYALEHNVDRLAEDHVRAGRLAECLATAAPARVNLFRVQTNIVLVSVDDAPAFAADARDAGVLVSVMGPRLVRLVTHLDVDDAGIERAAAVLAGLLAAA